MPTPPPPKPGRIDVVFIRKSSQVQDETGQKANVGAMLRELGVFVHDRYWFVCTVPRAKVQGNAEFRRLMELVEADKVGTVYIESQDRWGTADVSELFTLLGTLSEHGTRLFDLRDKTDLTGRDDTTQIRAFLGGLKSKKERQDLAFRSLRTRVNNFKDNGSWPTGTHPFGYGKRCLSPDGNDLWVWQPVSRSRGRLLTDPPGLLRPIPRKGRGERIQLVPSDNPKYVDTVRLVFDLYTRVGLSRRQISSRLNRDGFSFYDKPFSQSYVNQILTNPAYTGDTHFGKVQTGEIHTFDAQGLIVDAKGKSKKPSAGRIVKVGTHEPLIDRKTWDMARKKLEAERQRTSFSPRNPAYYLKQLFVCGHCGRNMTGRTETDWRTGKRTTVYVCSTYVKGRCGGHQVECGYQRITHEDAERLLLDKIKELDIEFDLSGCLLARTGLRERLALLGHEDEKMAAAWETWAKEGTEALMAYFRDTLDASSSEFRRLELISRCVYEGFNLKFAAWKMLPVDEAEFRAAVAAAEASSVERARQRVRELKDEHAAITLRWVKASEQMQAVLKQEIARLEEEIRNWEPRTERLTDRFAELLEAETERKAERDKLRDEWPALEGREKGEALRRLFDTVELYWDRKFHPALANPSRPRRTDRDGRYSYHLRKDLVEWKLAISNLSSSS